MMKLRPALKVAFAKKDREGELVFEMKRIIWSIEVELPQAPRCYGCLCWRSAVFLDVVVGTCQNRWLKTAYDDLAAADQGQARAKWYAARPAIWP